MKLPEIDWNPLHEIITKHGRIEGFVYPIQSAFGDIRWIRSFGEPFYNDDGRFQKYRGTGMDVTQMQNTLQKARAGEKLSKTILANLSHEIRIPLNAIVGLASLSAQSEDIDEIARNQELIEDCSKELLNTLNSVLELADLEHSKVRIKPEPVDLALWLQSCADTYESLARTKGMKLDVLPITKELSHVRFNRRRLTQAIGNILSNAIKFSNQGTITMMARAVEDKLRISVADQGQDISEGNIQRIFESFHQAESGFARLHDGTGLGLAVAREIVVAYGGAISVDSAVGRGSEFHVDVPLVIAHEPGPGRTTAGATNR